MTTTPEQLQAWREEGGKAWGTKASKYSTAYQFFIEGYLRRCQETEQAIKDARKQALEEARDLFSEGFAMLSTNQVREIIGGLLND